MNDPLDLLALFPILLIWIIASVIIAYDKDEFKKLNIMKTKKFISVAMYAFVFISVVLYVLFAFALWDLNAGNWTGGKRAMLSVFIGLSAFISMGISYLFNSEK